MRTTVVSPRVLISAAANDLHALAVADELNRLSTSAARVDFSAIACGARLTVALSSNGSDAWIKTDDGLCIDMAAIEMVWWRRALRPRDDPTLDETSRTFVRFEWQAFLDGLAVVAPHCHWVNWPLANHRAENKALQLRIAAECGFRVPATTISNDPNAVARLAQVHQELIYKRCSPAARPSIATRKMRRADFERLEVLPHCPAIFQEYIEAALDIRVTAIGSTLLAAEIDSQAGGSPVDWRLDQSVAFRCHNLDADVQQRLRAVLSKLDLVYAAIDLRLTPAGEYVFLEVNPSGQFLFLELLAAIPLSKAVAAYLAHGG